MPGYDDITALTTGQVVTQAIWTEVRDCARADAHGDYFLGGSRTVAIPFGGSAQDAIDYVEFEVPTSTEGGFTYVVVVEILTQNASTTVTPRLYNVTDSTVTWTGSAGTSTSWGTYQVSSTLTIAAAKKYRLQFTKNNDTYEAWGIGRVRRTYA